MSRSQKELIQYEFTKQAQAYSTNTTITDPERIARLVGAVHPSDESRVLEVASGPGFVALGFAEVCQEVVGIDLTIAPLRIAEHELERRGLKNLRFAVADAELLPFSDNEFDVVLCRLAFHHVVDPIVVLREMTRVCRIGGTVAVEDLISSEHPARAAYHNRFENLRDPSHTRALPLSELLRDFAEANLEVLSVRTDTIRQRAEGWIERAQTPPDLAAEVRSMIARDAAEDLSGTHSFEADGALHFLHTTATVVGRRLGKTPIGTEE